MSQSSDNMNLTLNVWRQKDADTKGTMETYHMKDVSPDMSFLEMLDILNEQLHAEGGEPIVFDHDCREGICGTCSLVINGQAHGPDEETTACQLHMRRFHDGDTITIDAEAGTIELEVDGAVLDERRARWEPRVNDYQSGALWRYAQNVGSARSGALTHPGAKSERHVFADI